MKMNQANDVYKLELISVSKSYNRTKALDNISMHVKKHEVIGLIGENGAGKSTLLKILGGIHKPDTGTLKVDGKDRILKNANAAAAAGIGVVHQEQSLLDNLSVAENISLGSSSFTAKSHDRAVTRFGFYRWKAIEQEGQNALTRIGASVSPKVKVGTLSFADKQMVEIAKAVFMAMSSGTDPVIILDEPTSVLDKDGIERLEQEIQRLKTIGSVIFVSHRLDEIRRICDRIYILRSGQIVAERQASEIDDDELFYLMTGRAMVKRRPIVSGSVNALPPVLELKHASCNKHFRDVSLTVESRQVHAIIGTRNSGREELCRAIFGIRTFDHGQILIAGKSLSSASIRNSIQNGVAYLSAERKTEGMIAGMSVTENIMLAHQGHTRLWPFISSNAQRRDAENWIRKLDIRPPRPDKDIGKLSGGNQQKVVLAKWVKDSRLKLLILDHPTRGVDPGAREYINTLIDELCLRGVGVLLLADTLDEAMMLGHRISVMKDGLISATFENQEGRAPNIAQLMKHMV